MADDLEFDFDKPYEPETAEGETANVDDQPTFEPPPSEDVPPPPDWSAFDVPETAEEDPAPDSSRDRGAAPEADEVPELAEPAPQEIPEAEVPVAPERGNEDLAVEQDQAPPAQEAAESLDDPEAVPPPQEPPASEPEPPAAEIPQAPERDFAGEWQQAMDAEVEKFKANGLHDDPWIKMEETARSWMKENYGYIKPEFVEQPMHDDIAAAQERAYAADRGE